MKQTSGALSLLLSAYRSVFSAAYAKGIAAAVVLTAGLAAGASQAAVEAPFADDAASASSPVNLTENKNVSLAGGEDQWANGGLSAGSSALNITGHGTFAVNGDAVLNGTKLTVSGSQGAEAMQFIGASAFDETTGKGTISGTLTATKSEITLSGTNSSIGFATVNITDSTINLSGTGSNIMAYGEGYDYQKSDAGSANTANKYDAADLSLSGVTVNMSNGTALAAKDGVFISGDSVINVKDGTVDIYGSARGDSDGLTIADTTINLTYTGSTVANLSSASGDVFLSDVTVSGGGYAFSTADTYISGNLTLNGKNSDKKDLGLVGGSGSTTEFTYTQDLTGNGATVNVNDASIGYANIDLTGGSLTVKGGSADNPANVVAYGDGENSGLSGSGITDTADFNLTEVTVNLQGNADIGTLSSLVIEGGSVNVTGTANTIYGSIGHDNNESGSTVDASTAFSIAENAALTIQAETLVDLTGSTFSNLGDLIVSGDVTVDSVDGLLAGEDATLTLSGNATVNSGAIDLTVDGISNTATAGSTTTLTALASDVTIDDATGSGYDTIFDNIVADSVLVKNTTSGSFTIVSGSSITAATGIDLANAGAEGVKTITVEGTLNLGHADAAANGGDLKGIDFTVNKGTGGSGAFAVNAGTWSNAGDVTVTSGSFTVGENAAISVADLTTTASNGTATVNGTLNVTNAHLAASTVTVNSTGTVNLDNGIFSVTNSGASVSVNGTSGANSIASGAFTLNGGTIGVGFDGSVSLTKDGLNALKDILVSNGSTTFNGVLDIGSAAIDSVTVDSGEISWDEIQSGGAAGVVTDNEDSDFSQANVTEIASGDTVSGVIGSAEMASGQGNTVQVANTVVLNGSAAAGDNYVQDATGNTGNITVASGKAATVTLAGNGGTVGTVTLSTSGSSFTTAAAGNVTTGAVTVSGDVTLAAGSNTVNGDITASGDVDLVSATALNGTSGVNTIAVTAGNTLTVSTAITADADKEVTLTGNTGVALEGAAIAGDNISLKIGSDTDASNESTISASNVNVKDITVGVATDTLRIDGNSSVSAQKLTNASGATIYVGSEGENSSTADVHVGTYVSASGDLVIDPEWTDPTAIFSAENISSQTTGDPDMTLDDNAVVGRNSALVIGLEEDEARAAVAQFQTSGRLSENGIGSLMYLNKQVKVDDGKGILLTTDRLTASTSATADTLTLNEGTALVITDEAFNSGSAIQFEDTTGSGSLVGAGGEVVLVGEFYTGDTLKIATTSGGTTAVAAVTGEVEVSTLNGILTATMDSTSKAQVTLALNEEEARTILNGASDPLYAALMDTFDKSWQGEEGTGLDYLKAAARNGNGSEADTAARMAVFGGAAQAALLAQSAATDAVAGRMGLANRDSAMVYADNAQGGALWAMPVYRNQDSDGFDAQGIDYGADIDLYGVILGTDFTTDSGVRAGAYFSVGSGDADGQGAASAVSNDFDYYGLGLYAGMSFGQFGVTLDAGFTQVSSDLDANSGATGFGTLTADTDTTAVTAGVTAQYTLETAAVNVVPHLGVRYTSLDMDAYDVASASGVVASNDAENHQIVSIPFGVSLSKEFAAGDWSVKPVFDVTLTANTGDTDFDSDSYFSGYGNVSTSSELMDDFTYGGSLGIQARYSDSLSLGVNLGYTGSDNTDEFGVTGDIRYMF